jgi:pyridoxal phosphate enzyme (YggS family)
MAESRTVRDGLGERLANIRSRIIQVLERSNRPTDDVTLVAISKTHPASTIKEIIKLGATDLGENRIKEAETKILEVGKDTVRWHLVGHLQANKARRAVKLFDVIHSLDSIELAKRLDRLCEEERAQVSVLIQVDLGMEDTKSGVSESDLAAVAGYVSKCEHLKFAGLMTLPPFFEDVELVRPFFQKLASLRDQLADQGMFPDSRGELSMGMTHDFEVAIEEGATIVRIGTAIFGERSQTE